MYKTLRNPDALLKYIFELTSDSSQQYYILLDEIQYVKDFEDVVNSLIKKENMDVYVTGSNSKFLSSDIITQFRGRGDVVHVYPLSFSEYAETFDGTLQQAWRLYSRFGGMPGMLTMKTDEQRMNYLSNLVTEVYKRDMEERYRIKKSDELTIVLDLLCSSSGSLTNPVRLSNTMRTQYRSSITDVTVNRYLEIMEESFLFEKARRYDVKGRKYLGSPVKFYPVDIGLRNAQLNFNVVGDLPHIMECIIYIELRSRGFNVDVGVIETRIPDNEISRSVKLEIDFVANKCDKRYYIQSAYSLPDSDKREQEIRPFRKIRDGFKRILVVSDDILPFRDENGVLTINIIDFLMDKDSMDL